MKYAALVWLMAGAATIPVRAQTDLAAKKQYIEIIKQHFEASSLQYRYRVQVAGTSHKQSVYDIAGTICLSGKHYYDSSGVYIQIRNKDHFMSLNHENKTASLVSARQYQSVFGTASLEQANVIYDLPPEVLDSMSSYEIRTEGGHKVLAFHFRQPVQGFSRARFVFSGNRLSEVEVVMQMTDRWGDQTGQLYTVKMHQFSNTVSPAVFSIQRFCSVSGQQVKWQSRYTRYQSYILL